MPALNRRPALVLRLCAALLLLPGLAGPEPLRPPPAAGLTISAADSKIAPWVLAHAPADDVEFLVILAAQADLSGADALSTKAEKGRYVVSQLRAAAQASQGPLRAVLDRQGVDYRAFYVVNAFWVKGDLALARTLAARADVAQIDGNPQLTADLGGPGLAPSSAALGPSAPNAIEASLLYVNADEVWALGYTGQGIVVGAQDTGYDWDHPALIEQYRGWNGSTADHDYNWHDSIHTPGSNCGADSAVPCDDNAHGTHTLGTAVGSDGAANQIGMAPGAQWIGCRNMNEGAGTPATYLECFEFFLAPYPVDGDPLDGNPDLAPDVTNNSWSCPEIGEGCSTTSLLAAVEAQRAAGIMTVVSAGNSGPSCSTVDEPPAIHAAVYAVGALQTGTDTIADFSSRGPVTADDSYRRKPDLTAPGTNIRSSIPGGTYAGGYSGTSMAAPHVAGAVALLWSAVPALRGQISVTEQILNDTAVPILSNACSSSGSPNNTYGYGRLDIKAAVDLALQTYGVLTGTVTDADTALPLPGATLHLTAPPTLAYTTTASALGAYSFAAPSGTYTLTAAAPGYFATTFTGLTITAGLTTTQAITLTAFPFKLWLPVLHDSVAAAVSLYDLFDIISGGALTPY